LIAAVTLGAGYLYYDPADGTWQTMMFTTLAFTQIGHALGLRVAAEDAPARLRANPALIGVTVLTVLLQLAAVYAPFLERFFQVVPLSAADFSVCIALGVVIWAAVEVERHLLRRRAIASQ
jgi:Ca2+-transporting ATPase